MSRPLVLASLAALTFGVAALMFYRVPGPAPNSGASNPPQAPQARPGDAGSANVYPAKASAAPAVPPGRFPSGSQKATLADLEAESTGRWIVKKNGYGYVSKLSDGRLASLAPTPEASARLFLEKYGPLVFGIDPGMAGEPEVIREAETTQVIVPFLINGLAVHGARHSQFYDAEGRLIYVVSDAIPGEIPSPTPALTHDEAAASAREGLLRYLGSADRARNEESYPLSLFLNQGRLMYRHVSGSLTLVYRYEFTLAPPAYGDMEAVVDASLGTAVVIQNITRK